MRVQSTIIAITFIIGASCVNLDQKFPDMPIIEFLRPFARGDLKKVDQYYRDLFYKTFNLNLNTKEHFAKMIAEITHLTPQDFPVELQKIDNDSLTQVFFNILMVFKHKLEGDFAQIGKPVEKVLRDYLIKTMIHDESFEIGSEVDIPDSVLDAAIKKLAETEQYLSQDMEGLKKKIKEGLKKLKTSYFKEHKPKIDDYLEYQTYKYKTLQDLLTQLTNQISENPSKLQTQEHQEAASKLLELVKALIILHKDVQQSPYQVVRDYGVTLIRAIGGVNQLHTNELLAKVIDEVLKIFTQTNNVEAIRLGKEFFLACFLPLDYEEPTVPYQRFILRKYRIEGLKVALHFNNYQYPKMLKFYTIDIINTSLYMRTELLDMEDLTYIFKNFRQFAYDYSEDGMQLIRKWRQMFLSAGDELVTYYSLFNGLYDALLHAAQYQTSGFMFNHPDINTYGMLFDTYLDAIYKWENSVKSKLIGWQPDAKHFSININNNYFFYKFINMKINMDNLMDQGVKFEKFKYTDDSLIHAYTLQRENKEIIDYLRRKAFTGPFNYASFAGAQIDGYHLKTFAKHQQLLSQYDVYFKDE